MTAPAETSLSKMSVEFAPPLARLVLRNPPLNVIDIPLMAELTAELEKIEARPDVSVVVLSGEGKSFSAGVNVADHMPDKIDLMLGKLHGVIRALVSSRKVTIAAVQGHCLGGGAEIAMVCDLVYTSTTAKWGFPEIKLGCYPPVGCTVLATLIGQKRAAELILTGKTISGTEAAEIGLATRAFGDEDVMCAIDKTVQELAQLSPTALAVTKKAIYAWDAVHFDKGLARAETIYLQELMKTADAHEGVRAFMEKREPRWSAR
jgi:cyclohexa-1,5-dienecarbonyl-CoA hydratase